jgi:carboxypeptidase C (cathepsin A)
MRFRIVLALFLCITFAATAQTTQPATKPAEDRLWDRMAVTEHQVMIAGQNVKYRASAGYLTLKAEDGKEKANIFSVAYTRTFDDPKHDPATRPITFVFNGGPGAASVWLHLGTAGPRRVQMGNEAGDPPSPPYRLVDNEYSWLDVTDLVFIDPVGTGYSRAAKEEKPEQFFGTREDVSWMAEFIRLFMTKNERWLSPKFLAGESYGTTRAAALSDFLAERNGIMLNGIVLVSVVLDFQTIRVDPTSSNDLPYMLFLPSYATIAHHHKKLPQELQQQDVAAVRKEVERFATNEYNAALAKGQSLSDDERKTIAQRLSRYTSLPVDFIDKAGLRIDPELFRRKLLESDRQLVGRFDARVKGFDPSPIALYPRYDPSLPSFFSAYGATMNDYARRVLRFESDLPYEVLTSRVRPWNFGTWNFEGSGGQGFLNVADDVRLAMIKNPSLRVMFCNGYFDLATPYFASDYTVSRFDLGPDLRKNITQTYYTAGHMMYHELKSLQKFKADFKTFIEGATAK